MGMMKVWREILFWGRGVLLLCMVVYSVYLPCLMVEVGPGDGSVSLKGAGGGVAVIVHPPGRPVNDHLYMGGVAGFDLEGVSAGARGPVVIACPYWFLVGMGWWVIWGRTKVKTVDRPGWVCGGCGYDLRGHRTGERCPECGMAVPRRRREAVSFFEVVRRRTLATEEKSDS